nr:hypothetical protein [Tanacetum cinerariifolium]
MAPTAVLTQSKPVFNTDVRPVSAAVPKIMVTRERLAHSPVTKSKPPIRWYITRSPSLKTSNSPPKVTPVKALVVSAAQALTTRALTAVTLGGELLVFGDGLRVMFRLMGDLDLVTGEWTSLGRVTMTLGTSALTGYNAAPPPIIGNFIPPKSNLVFHTAPIVVETDHLAFTIQLSPTKHSVQPVQAHILAATPKPTTPKTKKNKNLFCVQGGNHKQYDSLTHKKLQNHMAPTVILTQSKPVFNTAVRPVSADVPKVMVTRPRLVHSPVTKSKSPIRRNITRSPSPKTSNSPPKVTAVKALVVSAA